MHCLLVPNLKTATVLLTQGTSIEVFNKQCACLFQGIICFSSMDF